MIYRLSTSRDTGLNPIIEEKAMKLGCIQMEFDEHKRRTYYFKNKARASKFSKWLHRYSGYDTFIKTL